MTKAVFLDTTIRIAQLIHAPEVKLAIGHILRDYDLILTGLVVRGEFKRRFLRECKFLLDVLNDEKTLDKVFRRIHDFQTNNRKSRICVQIVQAFRENYCGPGTSDHEERFALLLKSLLKGGLDEFDQTVDVVVRDSGCEYGASGIRRRGDRFDFGSPSCSKSHDACLIDSFFLSSDVSKSTEAISGHLSSVDMSGKTDEIQKAEQFIDSLGTGTKPRQLDPCLTCGDLVISLESRKVIDFLTMNIRESHHFCHALNQTLVYRPPNPVHDTEVTKTDEW